VKVLSYFIFFVRILKLFSVTFFILYILIRTQTVSRLALRLRIVFHFRGYNENGVPKKQKNTA